MRDLLLRDVAEEGEYVAAKAAILDRFEIDEKTYQEFQETFDLVLGRVPEIYPVVEDGLNARMFRTKAGVLPSMRIWYSFNDEKVHLLYVRIVEDGQAEE
jgi:hypothetical protein